MTTALQYTVLAGNTFSSIAAGLSASAGVSYQAIEAANPNAPANALAVGMVLNIPAQTSGTIVLKYTVMAGDSFSKIASELGNCAGMTYQDIEAANPSVNPNTMAIGQMLTIPQTSGGAAPLPAPVPTPTPAAGNIGYWWWSWSSCACAPACTSISIAFSGYVNPQEAVQNSAHTESKLSGSKYICLGGGNTSGAWTSDALQQVTAAISNGTFAGYTGIAYDVEEGDSGLESLFQESFAAAKANNFAVLVTVSHSAPYGIADAATLMHSFFADPNIDFLSPQLYTTGSETSNDYATSGEVIWSQYAASKASVIPSIVNASMYESAQSYFQAQGVTLNGYVQWCQT